MIPDISVARPQRNYRWLLWLVAAIVFATDQLSKAYVASQLDLWERWQPFDRFPLNLFAITHTSNTGAAFGILPEFGLFFVIVAIVVSGATRAKLTAMISARSTPQAYSDSAARRMSTSSTAAVRVPFGTARPARPGDTVRRERRREDRCARG